MHGSDPATRRRNKAAPHPPKRAAPGAVLDGRDVGTVVCPGAEAKLFVTASPEVRARRRLLELRARRSEADLEGVLAAMRERDARDAARAVAPLVPAPDAVILDTTELSIEQALAAALAHVQACEAAAAAAGSGS